MQLPTQALLNGLGSVGSSGLSAQYVQSTRAYASGFENPFTGTPTFAGTAKTANIWMRVV